MNGLDNIHVLHVLSTLGCGGMELTMCRKVAALQDNMRHSILCLSGRVDIGRRLEGLAEIYCLSSKPNDIRLPEQLRRLLRTMRPSVIHSYNWGSWPDVAVARLGLRPPIPMVFSFHGSEGPMPLRRRVAFMLLARITPHLLTVCEASRRMLMRSFYWPRDRVSVIYNGVDTDLYHPVRTIYPRRRLVLGSAGGLRPVKNHLLLVGACAELRRRGIDVELLIAGDGPMRAALLDRIHLLGMGIRTKLLGSVWNMPEFYRRLDIFILPSLSEQNPNALLEAMATGLPCVATDVGSVSELLSDGRCGVIVPNNDKEALANALEELINDLPLRMKLGAAARNRACSEFNIKRMINAYRELYFNLASGVSQLNDMGAAA